jgi:hypothetical protein
MKLTSAQQFGRTWKRIPTHFLSLAAGLTVAASAAFAMGAFNPEGSTTTLTSAPESTRQWSGGDFPPNLVYYVVETEQGATELASAIFSEAATLDTGSPQVNVPAIRVVANGDQHEALWRELNHLSGLGIYYSIVEVGTP